MKGCEEQIKECEGEMKIFEWDFKDLKKKARDMINK
jgi:hypothetical protein